MSSSSHNPAYVPGSRFGFVKLLASSGSHCTKWADEQHRPAGFESRLVPDLPLPFIPTLIGLRDFDYVSSRAWWEAATNKQSAPIGEVPADFLEIYVWHYTLVSSSSHNSAYVPGTTCGFVKLLASSGSHCTKWADEQHRPPGFKSRLVPDLPLPFIPTLIGLRAFDHVSSRAWWEATTNK